MKLNPKYLNNDIFIEKIEGFALSSSYGNNKVFGQPKGLKSIGFVSIKTNNSIEGFGETYSGIYVPELIKPIIDFFKLKIEGKNLVFVMKNIDKFFDIPFVGFSGLLQSIKSAFYFACLDVLSKSIKVPIYKMYDSELKPVKVYVSGGSVTFSPDEIYNDCVKLKEIGFLKYKMRIGLKSLKEDILRIERAIEVFGNNNNVIVDLIQGTLKSNFTNNEYENLFRELNNFKLDWVEEPVEPWNINKLNKIKNLSKNKIATGEAYSGLVHFKELINKKYIDIIQYDLTHSGDFNTCFQISNIAKQNTVDEVLHVWGSSLALNSNLVFSLINNNIKIVEIPSVAFNMSKDINSISSKIDNGELIFNHEFLGGGVNINSKIKLKYSFVNNTGYSI